MEAADQVAQSDLHLHVLLLPRLGCECRFAVDLSRDNHLLAARAGTSRKKKPPGIAQPTLTPLTCPFGRTASYFLPLYYAPLVSPTLEDQGKTTLKCSIYVETLSYAKAMSLPCRGRDMRTPSGCALPYRSSMLQTKAAS